MGYLAMGTTVTQPRRLLSASAMAVLEEYDHEITLKDAGDFAIIYGPNGVGKTRFLEIIEALSSLNMTKLAKLPFRRAELVFSDDSRFAVEKTLPREEDDIPPVELANEAWDLVFTLNLPDREPIESLVNSTSDFETWLARMTPWHPTDRSDIWQSESDGDLIALRELHVRYFPRFRNNMRRRDEQVNQFELNSEITMFAAEIDIKLIETQRLMIFDIADEKNNRYGRADGARRIPTITQNSDEIKRLLDANLSANSRLTQSLDSTFPRRMLERGSTSALSETELREKWAEQTTLRARLTEIADLNVDPELSLPADRLNPWQLGMLELYLEDADKKLDSFAEVLAKINLLEDIVNERLLGKRIHINANNGMTITRLRDRSAIPLPALSSGEQHEIILMFDLLFNGRSGSVVLIDEPEISLHIGWQRKFIADVVRVSELVGFQFVVATHSPQIIDKWWSFATRLGPKSADFTGDEGGAADA